MTASEIVSQLKKFGIKYAEYKSWRTHNRNSKGAWGPVNGFMVHHTGSDSKDQRELLYSGLSNLPGPLCHFGLAQDGTVHLVGWGRANHAGSGDPDVLKAVINESYGANPPVDNQSTVDGNSRFYGVEIWYSGSHAMTDAQYKTLLKLAAAICDKHGWSEKSVIGHGEWGSPGKWDPGIKSGVMMNMANVRKDIKATIEGKKETPSAPSKPSKPSTPSKPAGKTHTIVKGDTLYSLSKKYGVTVAELKSWNSLKSDNLTVGDKLSVKAPEKAAERKYLEVKGYLPELRHGDEDWYVEYLQKNLNRFVSPKITVTKKYDDATAKAVDKFYKEQLKFETTTNGKVFGADGWRRLLSIKKDSKGTT